MAGSGQSPHQPVASAPGARTAATPAAPKRGSARTIVIAVAIAVIVVAAALGTAFTLGLFGNHASSSTSGGNGSQTLSAVGISPSSVSLGYAKIQVFSAIATNKTGEAITPVTGFVWSLDPGSLGTLNTTSGSSITFTSATSNQAGTLSVVASYNGISKSATASISVSSTGGSGVPSISQFAAAPANITLGQSTTLEVTASGGTPPLSYSYTGLPPGCTSDNTTHLSCTPTSAGTFDPTVTVTDSSGQSVEASTPLAVQGTSTFVQGTLLYQPSGANYSASQPSGTGVVTATDGTDYKVVLPTSFSPTIPITMAGSFQFAPDSSLSGYNYITSFSPSTPVSSPSPNAEVNLSFVSLGIAAANLTLGFSVSASNTVVYLAFGTYPTFFSNVTLQGVDLNVTTIAALLNVNLTWLAGIVEHVDPNLPPLPAAVVVVNQTIWLPGQAPITGQAQVIITPQNVSAFVQSVTSSGSAADTGMISAAMNETDEELVAVATAAPNRVTYSFLLAPIELDRTALAGIVTVGAEESYLSVNLVSGTNPNVTALGTPVRAFVGVTWDQRPMEASGYAASTVVDLWSVPAEKAVTLQAAAIGISLYDAGNALHAMGYSESQYVMDLASLQNPAIFVLMDPTIVQNPSMALSYRAYAVAIVPNDELELQTSIALYVTVNGVVYNTSEYLDSCAVTNLPACPILVADTITLGSPTSYLPYQLATLSAPTFVRTAGFLAGTTMKTIGQDMGGYGELVQQSPVDVGLYDLGYSDGTVGYNLPSVYLTWGNGPTLEVTNNYTEGLYIPVSDTIASNYLTNLSSYITGLGWNSSLIGALQSFISDVGKFVQNTILNGSLPVPGVLVMMDLSTNSSAGQGIAVATNVMARQSGCPYLLPKCVIADLSLSANSAAFLIPPTVVGILESVNGNANATINCPWQSAASSSCWFSSIPFPDIIQGCLPFGFCAFSPYHVVNLSSYVCYSTDLVGQLACSALLYWPNSYSAPGTTADVSFTIYWGWPSQSQVVATTTPVQVTLN